MISDLDSTAGATSHPFRVPGSENWRALLRTGANMLIIGQRCTLDAFLAAAADGMQAPVRLVTPADAIPVDGRGTLIVYDASSLAEAQQDALLALCGAETDRPQIISLSETHLWRSDGPLSLPLDLYYRLNTICLDLRDLASKHAVDHREVEDRKADPESPPEQPHTQRVRTGDRVDDRDVPSVKTA